VRRLVYLGITVAVLVGGFFLVRGLGILAGQLPEVGGGKGPAPGAQMRMVRLYFGARDHVALVGEDRPIQDPGSSDRLVEAIAREVFRGSPTGVSGLSPETRVRAFYLAPDGTGYLDLSSEFLSRWPQGDGYEWVSLGALVRSITENVPSIRCVQILVNGEVVDRAPGAIPLDLPLEADGFGALTPEVNR
jgi:hypothetical protein